MEIKEYEIREHGMDNAQNYPGAGASFTDWDNVQIGVGSNKHEALEDALEQLAFIGYNVEGIGNDYTDGDENLPCHGCLFNKHEDFPADECTECDLHYYIEVYIREDK